MTEIPSNHNTAEPKFAEDKNEVIEFLAGKRKYLRILIIILVLSVGIYIGLHLLFKGTKGEKISKDDIIYLTTIVNNQKNKFNAAVTNSPQDTARDQSAVNPVNSKILNENLQETIEMLGDYIINRYDADSIKLREKVTKEFKSKNFEEIPFHISSITFQINSFFWLSDEGKYIEVIFFSLFGVLCSLLYFCSEFLREGTFKIQELPVYWAKLFYAPIIALVLIFGLNLVITTNEILDTSSYGLFFLSFILGFFSGRAIELLNRIKDSIIPAKADLEKPDQDEPAAPSPPGNGVKYSISGVTRFEDESIKMEGNYGNIKVELFDKDENSISKETPVNPEGNFLITDLKKGQYKIKADAIIGDDSYSGESELIELNTTKPVIDNIEVQLNKNQN